MCDMFFRGVNFFKLFYGILFEIFDMFDKWWKKFYKLFFNFFHMFAVDLGDCFSRFVLSFLKTPQSGPLGSEFSGATEMQYYIQSRKV